MDMPRTNSTRTTGATPIKIFIIDGHGMTVRQIALRLQLSPKTIETYRENIKAKLKIDHASGLIRRAVQWVMEASACHG